MSNEFFWEVRVYYEDTDAGGVVFYANYLRYMERARTEWLRNVGYEHDILIKDHGLLFAVKDLSINYIKPGKLDDLLTVKSVLTRQRGASLVFQQTIHNAEAQLLSSADVKVVCLNAETLEIAALPNDLMMELSNDS